MDWGIWARLPINSLMDLLLCPGSGKTQITRKLSIVVIISLPSWLVAPLTRLETRTKKSNLYGSWLNFEALWNQRVACQLEERAPRHSSPLTSNGPLIIRGIKDGEVCRSRLESGTNDNCYRNIMRRSLNKWSRRWPHILETASSASSYVCMMIRAAK